MSEEHAGFGDSLVLSAAPSGGGGVTSVVVLSCLALVLVGQRGSNSQLEVSPKLLDGLRISRKRRSIQHVQRDWVRPNPKLVPTVGNLKLFGTYATLDANLVPNIKKAKIDIEDQGYRGTCTIFATKFLVEYELARQAKFKSAPRLNPEYLNWSANATSNSAGDGSSFPAVVTGLDQYGCSEWSEPKLYGKELSDFDPKYKPSDATIEKATPLKKSVGLVTIVNHSDHELTDSDMDTITGLLDAKIPVAVGQEWPSTGNWKSTKIDGFTIVDGTGPIKGAHTMAIVGYKKNPAAPGGGYFLFRNSWGTDWAAEGYHFMSFDWVRHHVYDVCIALPANWLS